MLSGRYRTGALTKHWAKDYDGCCIISQTCKGTVEDLPHILQFCPALFPTRSNLLDFTRIYVQDLPPAAAKLILELLDPSHPSFCTFLLDCTTLPPIISLVQMLGESSLFYLFDITRTWTFSLHRERLRRLNRWKRPDILNS